jgi:hypothetical protein
MPSGRRQQASEIGLPHRIRHATQIVTVEAQGVKSVKLHFLFMLARMQRELLESILQRGLRSPRLARRVGDSGRTSGTVVALVVRQNSKDSNMARR